MINSPTPYRPSMIRNVIPNASPGVYVLGFHEPSKRRFIPIYVGRSDYNVKERLLHHELAGKYPFFKYRLCNSAAEAYSEECFLWHGLKECKQTRNLIHPAAPSGSGLVCPYCTASKEFAQYTHMKQH